MTKKKEVILQAPVVKSELRSDSKVEKLEKELNLLRFDLESLKKSIQPNSTTTVPIRGGLV